MLFSTIVRSNDQINFEHFRISTHAAREKIEYIDYTVKYLLLNYLNNKIDLRQRLGYNLHYATN